jgi:hypothetical protein
MRLLFQKHALYVAFAFVASAVVSLAQGASIGEIGTISGSLQMDAQTYTQDSLIGAPNVPERLLSNTFVNVLFSSGKFTAGIRFESYQNPLLGIDPRFGTSGDGKGLGIPYRFATYTDSIFEVTAGNFYEQFGSGMILRTYEERNLGFDNSIDGVRLRFFPADGLRITGLIGRQRAFFTLSEGIMRGADVNYDLTEAAPEWLPKGVTANVGASVMSRFQADQNDFLKLPENVLAWSGRAHLGLGDVTLDGEYAFKVNDPGTANGNSFNSGNALYLTANYAAKGLGVNLAAKRIDNMDFRSDRTAAGFAQQVNYLPALTKQHTWRLITLYPYATQPTGEFGLQGDVTFTIPKHVLGADETNITLNGSVIHELDTTRTSPFTYDSKWGWDERVYYRDINIEITRKFGRDVKATLAYINLQYDQDIIERRAGPAEKAFGIITSNFIVLELWCQLERTQSIRAEFQYMAVSHEDGAQLALQNGDWVMALFEYTVSPHWFFTAFNEYNFGNDDPELRVNYPNVNVAYVKDALRVQGGYGRVRGGILCVGGICRPVPASNGLTMGVTYTF